MAAKGVDLLFMFVGVIQFAARLGMEKRGWDVVSLKVEDVAPQGYAIDRATVRQRKTGRPVKFEITEQIRQAVDAYLLSARKRPGDYIFNGQRGDGHFLTARQYARLLSEWIGGIGLDASQYGTHSIRRILLFSAPVQRNEYPVHQ